MLESDLSQLRSFKYTRKSDLKVELILKSSLPLFLTSIFSPYSLMLNYLPLLDHHTPVWV